MRRNPAVVCACTKPGHSRPQFSGCGRRRVRRHEGLVEKHRLKPHDELRLNMWNPSNPCIAWTTDVKRWWWSWWVDAVANNYASRAKQHNLQQPYITGDQWTVRILSGFKSLIFCGKCKLKTQSDVQTALSGAIAQRLRHLPVEWQVRGSNPTCGSQQKNPICLETFSKFLNGRRWGYFREIILSTVNDGEEDAFKKRSYKESASDSPVSL